MRSSKTSSGTASSSESSTAVMVYSEGSWDSMVE